MTIKGKGSFIQPSSVKPWDVKKSFLCLQLFAPLHCITISFLLLFVDISTQRQARETERRSVSCYHHLVDVRAVVWVRLEHPQDKSAEGVRVVVADGAEL